jgi:hypothetical protein
MKPYGKIAAVAIVPGKRTLPGRCGSPVVAWYVRDLAGED